MSRGVLLTNTRPPTSREISFWSARGFTVHYQSLLNVKLLPVEPLKINPQAIALTSANAARALEHSDWDRYIPVYGVGIATADAAKAAGFLDCSSPSDKPYPSALNLIEWIKKNLDPQAGSLVFGCGSQIRHDIAEKLKPLGFKTEKVMLYKTLATDNFCQNIESSLKNFEIDTVAIYSEQSLLILVSLCKKLNIPISNFSFLVPSEFLKNTATQLGCSEVSIFWKKPFRTSKR